jgi:hypothetical protein
MMYTLILWILFPGQPRPAHPDVTIPGFQLEQTCDETAAIIAEANDTHTVIYNCVREGVS